MTIYVLKSINGQYVTKAGAKLRINRQTGQAQLLENPILEYTNDINKAQLLENPNFEEIENWKLRAVIVQATKPIVKEKGNVYEMVT